MNVLFTALSLSLASGAYGLCTKPIALIPPASHQTDDISRSRHPQLDTVVVSRILSQLGCSVVVGGGQKRSPSHALKLFEGRTDNSIPVGYSGVWLRNRVYGFMASSAPLAGRLAGLSDLAAFVRNRDIKLGLHPSNRYGLTLRRLYRQFGMPQNIVFNQSLERRIRLLLEGKVDLIYDDLIHAHRTHAALGSPAPLKGLPLFIRVEPVFLIAPQPIDPELTAVLEKLAQRADAIKDGYSSELAAIVSDEAMRRKLVGLVTSPRRQH